MLLLLPTSPQRLGRLRSRPRPLPRRYREQEGSPTPSNFQKHSCTSDMAVAATFRKRPGMGDCLVRHGRHFGRTVDAFGSIYDIITYGLDVSVRSTSTGFPATKVTSLHGLNKRMWNAYRQLLLAVPYLETELESASDEEIQYISGLINKGMSLARLDDKRSIRMDIASWIQVEISADSPLNLAMTDKRSWGFSNYATGALLCPIGWKWDDPHVQAMLRSCSGDLAISSSAWPLFVYSNGRVDPEDSWDGLFRGRLLVLAYRRIFTSKHSLALERSVHGKTQPGDHCLYGMTNVTLNSIAYVAAHAWRLQVRLALSSTYFFKEKDTAAISSSDLYESALGFFEKHIHDGRIHALLSWWDYLASGFA
ncbi:hypothetical protein DXG01_014358 [Tephrocybe rancida]|nr:hypothetical protein DXG01_014358 [Tephrocybe rancida]